MEYEAYTHKGYRLIGWYEPDERFYVAGQGAAWVYRTVAEAEYDLGVIFRGIA